MTVYAQDGYAVRLEWGADGVRSLAPHCTVLIIVDVLVFTTSVTVALERGARVMPLPWGDERADEAALRAGAVLTRSGLTRDSTGVTTVDRSASGPTLRPSSLVNLAAGTLLAIASPNGGSLSSAAAASGATVLAGSLRNASAVAAAARTLAGERPIGLVPAGERWRDAGDGTPNAVERSGNAGERWYGAGERRLRPSTEELLGAGAIAHSLGMTGCSPEAELAALAYGAARGRVRELLAGCVSGRELIRAGVPADVELAGDVDRCDVVPILTGGVFEPWTGRTDT